jgi:hypothetical protein
MMPKAISENSRQTRARKIGDGKRKNFLFPRLPRRRAGFKGEIDRSKERRGEKLAQRQNAERRDQIGRNRRGRINIGCPRNPAPDVIGNAGRERDQTDVKNDDKSRKFDALELQI